MCLQSSLKVPLPPMSSGAKPRPTLSSCVPICIGSPYGSLRIQRRPALPAPFLCRARDVLPRPPVSSCVRRYPILSFPVPRHSCHPHASAVVLVHLFSSLDYMAALHYLPSRIPRRPSASSAATGSELRSAHAPRTCACAVDPWRMRRKAMRNSEDCFCAAWSI